MMRYRSPIALSPGGDDPDTVYPDHNGNLYALREASGTYGLTAKQIGRKRGGKITIRYGFDVRFARRSDQYPTFEIRNTIYGPNGHDIGMSIDMVYKVRPKLIREYGHWTSSHFGLKDDKAFVNNAVFWAFELFHVSGYKVVYRDEELPDLFKKILHIGKVEGDQEWLDNLEVEFGYLRQLQSDYIKSVIREELRTVVRREAHARWPKVQDAFIQDMLELKVIRPAVMPSLEPKDATL